MDDYPKLSYLRRSFLIARDRQTRMVKLGGLGAFGVGEMWFIEEECGPDTFERSLADRLNGWETAPQEACPKEEARCIAHCPFHLSPDIPRCWLIAGHSGQHSVGYGALKVLW